MTNDTTFRRVAFLSINHITEEDYYTLRGCTDDVYLVWDEKNDELNYGLWLYVTHDPQDIDDDLSFMSDSIVTVMKWAFANGVHYIRFTPDEDPINELPTYDWK